MVKRIPFPYLYRVKSKADMQAGARGNHKWGMIDIRDDQGAPVLAQEIMEEDFLMVRCHIPNAIVGAVVGAHIDGVVGGAIGVFAALIFGYLFWRTVIGPITGWHRLMEYRGHMVTFRLWGLRDNLYQTARSLSHYSQFKGMPVGYIYAGLVAEDRWAERWLDANREFVEAKADALGL